MLNDHIMSLCVASMRDCDDLYWSSPPVLEFGETAGTDNLDLFRHGVRTSRLTLIGLELMHIQRVVAEPPRRRLQSRTIDRWVTHEFAPFGCDYVAGGSRFAYTDTEHTSFSLLSTLSTCCGMSVFGRVCFDDECLGETDEKSRK